MKHYNLKQVTLSQRLRVSKGYVSMLVNEKEPLTINLVNTILKSFPSLNSFWVLTGEGEMFLEQKTMPDGILDPQVMEDDVEYGLRNGGIFEDLSARVRALEDAVRELRDKMDGMEDGKGA